MPSSCPNVVCNQPPTASTQRVNPPRLGRPVHRTLNAPSPLISDGTTTEIDLCTWTECFARLHTDPAGLYVPLALRTVDCIVAVQREQPAESLVPRLMRCVREVAKFNGAKAIEWKLITWVPGLPGAKFQGCLSEADAMRMLDAPPAPISF